MQLAISQYINLIKFFQGIIENVDCELKYAETICVTPVKDIWTPYSVKNLSITAKEDIYYITWAKNTDYGRNARVDYEVHHALTSSMEKTKRLTVLKKENLIIKGIILIKMN